MDKHLDFSKKYGLDFPLLSDKGGVVSDKYGSLLDLGFIGKLVASNEIRELYCS